MVTMTNKMLEELYGAKIPEGANTSLFLDLSEKNDVVDGYRKGKNEMLSLDDLTQKENPLYGADTEENKTLSLYGYEETVSLVSARDNGHGGTEYYPAGHTKHWVPTRLAV